MNKKLRIAIFLGVISAILWNCASEIPTLKVARSAKKDILSFKFMDFTPAVEGDIDTTLRTVLIRVPVATKVTALKPTIKVSAEASISPNTEVAQNFTAPVTYFVTASDCTKRAYRVSVIVALSTDPEIIGIETILAKTTESFFIYGKNFSRATPTFFLTSKTTGKVYNLTTVFRTLTATQARVQIPFDVPVGLYSVSVTVNGRTFKYRALDLKVTGEGTEMVVNRMTLLTYVRGNEIIIKGNNMKAATPQIRFVPQIAGTIVTKNATLNLDETELRYKIEPTFVVPNRWILTVILGDKQFPLPDLVTITR
ncbi:MAG: hypothetical protein U5N85_07740 [Arcicella sp.]|nr:hypothetical protein [Arcicella sp.]